MLVVALLVMKQPRAGAAVGGVGRVDMPANPFGPCEAAP